MQCKSQWQNLTYLIKTYIQPKLASTVCFPSFIFCISNWVSYLLENLQCNVYIFNYQDYNTFPVTKKTNNIGERVIKLLTKGTVDKLCKFDAHKTAYKLRFSPLIEWLTAEPGVLIKYNGQSQRFCKLKVQGQKLS